MVVSKFSGQTVGRRLYNTTLKKVKFKEEYVQVMISQEANCSQT